MYSVVHHYDFKSTTPFKVGKEQRIELLSTAFVPPEYTTFGGDPGKAYWQCKTDDGWVRFELTIEGKLEAAEERKGEVKFQRFRPKEIQSKDEVCVFP